MIISYNSPTKTISLDAYGIKNATVHYQQSSDQLHNIILEQGHGVETSSGAIAIRTGKFTGRSPKDRFIVKDSITKDKIWWSNINIPFKADDFDALYNKVVVYLSEKSVFVRDGYVCADTSYRMSVRVIAELPWSVLFVYNMFLRPDEEDLAGFTPEWTIINAPGFLASPENDGTRAENFTLLNFTKKIVLIGGTGYTGEIKKGIFSALNFILPEHKNTLPMHCSANVGSDGSTAIFLGLSGTGKTTLSTVHDRALIGDDEHGWAPENTVFNFEGGCYAKVINITETQEPDIYKAIKRGAMLENVIVKANGDVVYSDASITQNTRVSYPIDHIKNIQVPSVGKNPKHIFFLTADAFGILPPIAKLNPVQAAYHFISGYTAKIAGTEEGVSEPIPHFSACFGAPFMPMHPTHYARMLSKKIQDSGVCVWLVNTGWIGGPYRIGSRIQLQYTRAIINAALDYTLQDIPCYAHPVFGIAVPLSCPKVPSMILNPRNTWKNKDEYDKSAVALAHAFHKNFERFMIHSDPILAGAPIRSA